MKRAIRGGRWILQDCQQFVANFFLSQAIDEPLPLFLKRAFTQVLSKLLFYTDSSCGLHIFANVLPDKLEIHYLYLDSASAPKQIGALKARHGLTLQEDTWLPDYGNIVVQGYPHQKGLLHDLRELLRPDDHQVPHRGKSARWNDLISWIGEEYAKAGGDRMNSHVSECITSCTTERLFVIPLGLVTEKFPLGPLGTILVWNNKPAYSDEELVVREGLLRPVTRLLSASISRFLKLHYQIDEETYLPKYRNAGAKDVAVLFADIRNFTPTTEVMRNFNLLPQLIKFMHDYCFCMGQIVKENGGRVQSYAGDGVMAIFGEYMSGPRRAVATAASAAVQMCQKFEWLRSKLLERPEVASFLVREYEPLEFALGIGINFGQTIFDYFGPPAARVFSPLGDHVNFAQRLESEAYRYDSRLGRPRAQILLSRPAWIALGRPEWNVVDVEVKGKPLTYQAYECEPNEKCSELIKTALK